MRNKQFTKMRKMLRLLILSAFIAIVVMANCDSGSYSGSLARREYVPGLLDRLNNRKTYGCPDDHDQYGATQDIWNP